ncbi:hypothetical protein D9M70_459080 [compost metagenome]
MVLVLAGGAGDHRALEVGVSLHADVKATFARVDARLFAHVRIAAARLPLVRGETGRAAPLADAEPAAHAFLLGAHLLGVLSAGDIQVAAHIAHDLAATDRGAHDVGVIARHEGNRVLAAHVTVDMCGSCAVRVARGLGGRGRYAKALRAVGYADARAARLVGAV